MLIKATSEEHAREIFDELEAKGYKFRLSYFNTQEWVHPYEETVLVGKCFGYKRYRHLF